MSKVRDLMPIICRVLSGILWGVEKEDARRGKENRKVEGNENRRNGGKWNEIQTFEASADGSSTIPKNSFALSRSISLTFW